MNLVYGEIMEVFTADGIRMGRIRVGGAIKKMALELIPEAQPGDTVLLCDGVAISQVREEATHVSGNSR